MLSRRLRHRPPQPLHAGTQSSFGSAIRIGRLGEGDQKAGDCRTIARQRQRRAVALGWALFGVATPTLAAPVLATTTQAEQAPASRHYEVAGGSLGNVLARFAAAAGIPLSFDPASLAGRTSNGLSGDYTVSSAFDQLLAGSGFEAFDAGNGRYLLRPRPTRPDTSAAGQDQFRTLAPVTVTGRSDRTADSTRVYPGGQVARGGSVGILGNTDYMSTPYSQSSVTAEQMENRQARTLTDALAADPGVVSVYETAGYYAERFMVRGFNVNQTTQSDILFNGLYGLANNYSNSATVAERVEVLKGPNALLNGAAPSGSLGGAINIVTKRAGDEPLTRIGIDFESRSQGGVQVDVGRRFGDTGDWGIRFNGRYGDGQTTTHDNGSGTRLGALALDYRGARLKASLDLIHQQNRTRRLPSYTAVWSYEDTELPAAPDVRINTSDPGAWSREVDQTVLLASEFALTEQWTLYGAAGRSDWTYKAAEMTTVVRNRSGDSERALYGFNTDVDRQSYRVGIRGRLQTGPVAHRLVVNAERYRAVQREGYTTTQLADGNIYVPVSGAATALWLPSRPYGSSEAVWGQKLNATFDSLALADTVSLLDERLQFVLGVRHQRIRQVRHDAEGELDTVYDRKALTPTIAAIGKLSPRWSVYGNVIQGLSQGDTAPTADEYPDLVNPGAMLAPYKTRQKELGLKFDGGRVGATLSAFRIEKPSATVGADNVFAINGRQRNDGWEFAVFGEPRRGIRLAGGLTLLDARLRQTATGEDEGHRVLGVPKRQLKLNGEWDLAAVPGVTLTGGVIHVSGQFANNANTLAIPGWTLFDVGARYVTRVGGRDLALRAGIHNLTNRNHYWASVADYGGLFVGVPRTFQLSASIDL